MVATIAALIFLGAVVVFFDYASRAELRCSADDEPWKTWDGTEPTFDEPDK